MDSIPAVANGTNSDEQKIGILTKSIIRSPVCKWLLHARLRHETLNDLVLVGEDFIHVKQVGECGHLNHIASKNDFDVQIRAAKVFSVDPEQADEDALIKGEHGPDEDGTLSVPPEFLVLTLANNDLVFLFLTCGSDGCPHFVQQPCPMPTFHRTLFQPGEHLAVDSRSRAIAVAASEREVILYSAKPKDRIRNEVQSGSRDWCPVAVQRPIQVDGVIQLMDFLIPPDDDRDHIVLLLIVVNQRKTKAVRVDWYWTSDLHDVQKHPGQLLYTAATVSSLLIPLRNADFLLVRGSEIFIWRQILSGAVSGSLLATLDAEPRRSGDSPMKPVWASWCRPRRSPAARRGRDHVYLVREDGLVCLVQVRGSSLTSSSAGHLHCHVGTAFASLGNTSDPDILAVAGDMSTGRVIKIGQWSNTRVSDLSWNDTMKMDLVETIPNWGSITDAVTTSYRHARSRSARSAPSSSTVLVTSGRQPYGAVTELRRGVEARLLIYLELSGLSSTNDIWTVPEANKGSVLMFVANPISTRLISIDEKWGEPEFAELDADDCPALDLAQPTLAVGLDADQRIVQVTTSSVIVTANLHPHFEDTHRRVRPDDGAIVAAAIHTMQSTVLTAERRGEGYVLCSLKLSAQSEVGAEETMSDGTHAETVMPLNGVPTALDIASSNSGLLCLVACTDGSLTLAEVTSANKLESRTAVSGSSNEFAICDSATILQKEEPDQIIAVCGLRDGRIVSIAIEGDTLGGYQFGSSIAITLGQSTVKIVKMQSDRSQAFALSGADTCLLSWGGCSERDLTVRNIWTTNKDNPDPLQKSVLACAQLPGPDLVRHPSLADSLLLIAGDDILMADLVPTPTTVPRQIPVSGTPTRLIYAEQQRCLVVASFKTHLKSFPTPGSQPEERRQIWPVIDFIPSRSSASSMTYDMQPGERVFTMIEWSLKLSDANEEKRYSFVLVGGSYTRSSGGQGGRIIFLQPINRNWEVVGVKRNTMDLRFDAPVYALTKYDDFTIVVCYGEYVMLWRCSLGERRWREASLPFKLSSSGLYASVEDSVIYISTARDSLVTLRLSTSIGDALPQLVQLANGPQAHNSLCHLVVHPYKGKPLTLLTTKNCQIIGLHTSNPPNLEDNPSTAPQHFLSASTAFEARLRHSLTRLRQANLRPPWKTPTPAGVLLDNIVGTAADGTLVGLALLEPQLWRQLFWLQRLCEWSEELSPHSWQTPSYTAADEDGASLVVGRERLLPVGLSTRVAASGGAEEIMLYTLSEGAEDMHIDGDVLARVLEKGGDEVLRRVLVAVAERDDRVGVWVQAHLREELEAVEGVVGVLRVVLDRWI
ncbi:hypothetical protein B0A50_06587 [Salinomyces thailandicus]|uniref:Uncharacterized protein n=1 Tax=Salinomyces thailandicus TaxID=706561 RepID=A0A4U0TRU7_9PEZI|nr:hypothetical protein B0A50_06587 [Salinomyces thailandica]